MSLITDLITHITTNSSTFNRVEHAWTMEAIDEHTNEVPALFLSHGIETSLEASTSPVVNQQTTKEINIYIVCDSSELESIMSEVNSLVQGWQYDQYHTQMMHKKGLPQDINGKYIWYMETYYTKYHRRSSLN